MRFFQKILGDPNEKELKKYRLIVEQINGREPGFLDISDGSLKEKAEQLKQQFKAGRLLDDILPEAFALAREASSRALKQRPFDVQAIGGIALHYGKIAEMKTGEGKTLAAVLPAFLNGLSGKGVHIITVNDYLAKRDAVWMGQVYHALGLSVGCIVNGNSYLYDENFGGEMRNEKLKMKNENEKSKNKEDEDRDRIGGFKVEESYLRPCSRKDAYGADITYGTNNEFAFDYLRDNMVFDAAQMVQRGFNFAIVDEIDSILIDEARTPLIISQPDYESSGHYKDFARIIPRLTKDEDYNVDEKMKTAVLTEAGIEKVEKILGLQNIYEEKGVKYLHYLEQSLRAQALFHKDKDYLVKNNEVLIIDEFTGRILPGRRYSAGLHQAIEAKEGVPVQAESRILGSITFQNYFRLYEKLSGMTGTALTSAEEFDKVYKLSVLPIPTNKPLIRQDLQDQIFKTEQAKLKAIVHEVKERNQKGQPILLGTRSVEKNEHLSKLLSREGIKHEVLNAKNHSREGEIIAMAGQLGAVTVATNMAGRGVDIKLGGVPPNNFKFQISNFKFNNEENISNIEYKKWEGERERVLELGGLCIIGTERHEARRIDNQLRGRAGRQGDPGVSQFFVSLEDELMRIFGGEKIKNLMNVLKFPEDQPLQSRIISSSIEKAQTKVEGFNFDARTYVLEYDDVLAKHRAKIYSQRKKILQDGYESLKQMARDILKQEIEKILSGGGKEEIKIIMPLPENNDYSLESLINHSYRLLDMREAKEGKDGLMNVLRFVFLRAIDDFWTEHLVNMDHLKDSSRLKAYGGKDPLVEYKTEGHKMFQGLWQDINSQIARTIFKVGFAKK